MGSHWRSSGGRGPALTSWLQILNQLLLGCVAGRVSKSFLNLSFLISEMGEVITPTSGDEKTEMSVKPAAQSLAPECRHSDRYFGDRAQGQAGPGPGGVGLQQETSTQNRSLEISVTREKTEITNTRPLFCQNHRE